MRKNTTKKSMSLHLFIERILSAVTIVDLACLGIGIPLFIVGRTFNDSIMTRAGAYILLIGVVLAGMKIFYWITEEMVGRGLKYMTKQHIVHFDRIGKRKSPFEEWGFYSANGRRF